jgi:putative hydrolase
MADPLNRDIADRLDEVARVLSDQHADQFRVNAYDGAAASIRQWPRPVSELFRERGLQGLEELPRVGPSVARAIRDLLTRGRIPLLDRLRGSLPPPTVLASVPGIGSRLAERLHEQLGLSTLDELESAAHDGRLESIAGFGEKRITGIRDSLAQRLGRLRPVKRAPSSVLPVEELLDVDREYRYKVATRELPQIAPRRFNPTGEAWLPILHTTRGARHYTALFSNTARAYSAGRTRDWVVIYGDDDTGEWQYTVITAQRGPLRGCRVVAGRESECEAVADHAA